MKLGYLSASATDPDLEMQHTALKSAGCRKIIADEAWESPIARPGLFAIKEQINPGDILVVWRLDRLAHSMRDLLNWMTYLDARDIGLISLHDGIDTTGPAGKLVFKVFGALGNFERNLTRERRQTTLTASRSRGEKFGRPVALNQEQRDLAVRLYRERKTPVAQICREIGISKPTLYSYVRAAEEAEAGPASE